MKKSPLSLEHYHLLEVSIEPEAGYTPVEEYYPDFSNASLTTKIGVGASINSDKSNQYALKLSIEIYPEKEKSFPYTVKISMEGFFKIVDENLINDAKNLMLINGPSMLYGAIREFLLILTARFEYGALMLPTVNFLDMYEEKKVVSENGES